MFAWLVRRLHDLPRGALHSPDVSYRDARTEALAAEAARLLAEGVASTVGGAIRLAAEGGPFEHVQRPGYGRVRQHLQALRMASMGQAAYDADVHRTLAVAEEVMTLLDDHVDHVGLFLVGRAAAGLVDGGGALHIRLYSRAGDGDVAALLVSFGFDEPRFTTARTRLGRISQLELVDDGTEIVITCCPPGYLARARENLVTGQPVPLLTLEALRQRLDRDRSE